MGKTQSLLERDITGQTEEMLNTKIIMMVMYYNTLNKNKSVFPHSYSKEREKGNRRNSSLQKKK